MSRKIAEEVLPRLRQRYVGRGREGRSRLIDEVCEQWDYSRKHAIFYPPGLPLHFPTAMVAAISYGAIKCSFCNGTGWQGPFSCVHCKGTGRAGG